MKHGTHWTYRYYKCRCDLCRVGNYEYRKDWKNRRHAAAIASGKPTPHGTRDGFEVFRCRCDECRRFMRDKRASQPSWSPEVAKIRKHKSVLKRYGLDPDLYLALLDQQGGVCAICRRSASEVDPRRKNLCVDHDHETDVVRGLLCTECNLCLGRLGDNADRLRAAADYLDRAVRGPTLTASDMREARFQLLGHRRGKVAV